MYEALEGRRLLALTIEFNYTLDTNHFFDGPERRALLEEAASVFTSRIQDTLLAISPQGSDSWVAKFAHPGTGVPHEINNLTIAANKIVVYAGGRDLGGSTLGQGGPGGSFATGTGNWPQTVVGRGQINAIDDNASDFALWGGVITFDTVGTNWFFGETTQGLTAGQADFLTVATHEMAHLLGFGASTSFSNLVVPVRKFNGAESIAEYDIGGQVLLHTDNAHWADGTTDGGAETLMDPTITNGTRKGMTPLDFAALDDLGWDLSVNTAPQLNASGNPQLTAIKEEELNNPGTLITTLLASGAGGNPVTDPDPGAVEGIAVVAADTSQGSWQYSTNGGTNWQALGAVSETDARLLAADGATRIRLVPQANFSGTLSSAITFRAWDRTTGANGGTTNIAATGGTSAFSSATETAAITVAGLPDGAPFVTPASTLEDTQSTLGLVILHNPVDGAEVTHFKITSITSGALFLNDGVTAVINGTFITAAQGALGLRFSPATHFNGGASFVAQSSAGASDAGLGGPSATASITVTPVNDAPSFVAAGNVSSFAGAQTRAGWATQISKGPSDEQGQFLTFLAETTDQAMFDVLPAIDAAGTLTFTPHLGSRGTANITVRLKDNGGQANSGSDTSGSVNLQISINTIPWQNTVNALDVDSSGDVTPLDALIIINDLNALGPRDLPNSLPGSGQFFLDVSGDGVTTPLDALIVINFLNDGAGPVPMQNAAQVGQATADARSANATAVAPTPVAAVTSEPLSGNVSDQVNTAVAPDMFVPVSSTSEIAAKRPLGANEAQAQEHRFMPLDAADFEMLLMAAAERQPAVRPRTLVADACIDDEALHLDDLIAEFAREQVASHTAATR